MANGLLKEKGFKEVRRLARTAKKIYRLMNQAKLRSYRTSVKYKYGVAVPQGHKMAMRFDKENGNTLWADAEKHEAGALNERFVFKDLGKGGKLPKGYSQIRVHMVYDVKHDGRRRARLVADGNLTSLPTESIYSGVVTLRSTRIIAFLAELNDLKIWGTDISSAYIESYTSEKVGIVAGPEFGELEGHTLIIIRALYGLRSSGRCWHDRFAGVLETMGFKQCLADNDVWMRDKGDHYEYIGVYVDDLQIASRAPDDIIKSLQVDHKFSLKGTGPLTFHLGCDFVRDEDGTLVMTPRKYIQRMVQNYSRLFGGEPRHYMSPLDKGDHPELDDSDLLGPDDIKIYQSLIGSLQWCVSLGRLDVATAVMTLSSFRVAPRIGHLVRSR